jgi:hypothetical protein
MTSGLDCPKLGQVARDNTVNVTATKKRKLNKSLKISALLFLCGSTAALLLPDFSYGQEPVLMDSFTLNADLSGGDVNCPAGVTTQLAYGTQESVPAGLWQVAWNNTFYVTFGDDLPNALTFTFWVYAGHTRVETVTYNVEPGLFTQGATKEFSFAVGTRGNDGNNSGVNSTSPFLLTVYGFCTSIGAAVVVKGDSHLLQLILPD